jgi:hypothetical protein
MSTANIATPAASNNRYDQDYNNDVNDSDNTHTAPRLHRNSDYIVDMAFSTTL